MGDFKPGDVVRLTAGGPIMSVQGIGNDFALGKAGVLCRWHDDTRAREEVYQPESLILVKEVGPIRETE